MRAGDLTSICLIFSVKSLRSFVIPSIDQREVELYDDVPIVRFRPRMEGSMLNEVFVNPAKVVGKIPVVDDKVEPEPQSIAQHILPISPEKQKKRKKSHRSKKPRLKSHDNTKVNQKLKSHKRKKHRDDP